MGFNSAFKVLSKTIWKYVAALGSSSNYSYLWRLIEVNLSIFTFIGLRVVNVNVFLSITNQTQHYTTIFITINALHVSGGSSAHHQELKTIHSIGFLSSIYCFLPLVARSNKCSTKTGTVSVLIGTDGSSKGYSMRLHGKEGYAKKDRKKESG
jgi:hypothetical protein